MTDSKHEMEILSTCFEQEDDGSCITKLLDADQKVAHLAKIIIKLKNDLNTENTENGSETDLCFIKKQLVMIEEKHCNAVNETLELARMINFDIENLEGLKIDINQYDNSNDMTVIDNDSNKEIINPIVVVKNDSTHVFMYDQQRDTSFNEDYNSAPCSENDGHKNEACSESEEFCSTINNNCKTRNKSLYPDFEKKAIRDDIMALAGEMKLLRRQNSDLLKNLDCSKQQTKIAIQKKSDFMRYKPEYGKCTSVVPKSIGTNCVEKKDNNKTKLLTDEFFQLIALYKDQKSENEILRCRLDEEKHNNRTYEDRLMISKTQVAQLEKQLFELSLAPSNDHEVLHQNAQYVIASLRHRLREANEKINNLLTMFDFRMTELEDYKHKYLAVLQTNEEQKNNIELLREQGRTTAKDYEVEFNRMNEHLQKRLEEVKSLPALLAAAQRDLENEKLARIELEKNVECLKDETDNLKSSLSCDDNYELIRKDLAEENIKLKATMQTLNDSLSEIKRRYTERSHSMLQLKEQLDSVREEAAIQVTKIKDVSDYQKLKYTDCIKNLEQELAECRAKACANIKKRDKIDERLLNQIETLTKSLNDAQKKIGEFQGTNRLIELKIEEEFCKIPRIMESKCRDVNKNTDHANDK